MLDNMTTGEKVIAGATAVGIAALIFHKPTRNAVGLSDGKRGKAKYYITKTTNNRRQILLNTNNYELALKRFDMQKRRGKTKNEDENYLVLWERKNNKHIIKKEKNL